MRELVLVLTTAVLSSSVVEGLAASDDSSDASDYDYGDYFDLPDSSPDSAPSTDSPWKLTTRSSVVGSIDDAPPASVAPDGVVYYAPELRRRERPTTTPSAPSSEATTRRSAVRSTRGRQLTSTRRSLRVTTMPTTTPRLSRSSADDGGVGDDSWLRESSPFLMVLGEEDNYPSQRSPNASHDWSALWLRKLELESKLNDLKYSYASASARPEISEIPTDIPN